MEDLKLPVERIVNLLVAQRYDDIVLLTHGKRLDSKAIQRAISEYGRKLTSPPEAAFDNLDIVPVSKSNVPEWSVRMNLWTEEEGMSDLSIELSLTQSGNDYSITLDDIHVM